MPVSIKSSRGKFYLSFTFSITPRHQKKTSM